jgi:hypothetical protein
MKRFLIGQLGVYGDCLYATTIARQIKHDNPDCELTWAIGSNYANVLKNNPYIDKVLEYQINSRLEVKTKWYDFVKLALSLQKVTGYDEVYFTQAYPGNPDKFYGSIRSAMFSVYPKPITVPLDPVIVLSPDEVDHVNQFADKHKLKEKKNVILFECSPQSGQSFMTAKKVWDIAEAVTTRIPDTCVILSGTDTLCCNTNPNIIDASVLSFRENAHLTRYCTLLVGTGSGITQICMSDWAFALPTIQLLQKHTVASMIVDRKKLGLSTIGIVEMTNCEVTRVVDCIEIMITDSYIIAYGRYHEDVEPDFNMIRFHMRFDTAIITHKYFDIIPAFIITCKDYGFDIGGLLRFFLSFPKNIIKFIHHKRQGVY